MTRRERKRLQCEKIIEEKGIICLENVTKSFPGGAHAVNDVSFQIKQGEFVFIVGDNGSGKSTLLKLFLRELVASQGKVTVMGQDLSKIRHRQIPKFRRNLGVVFQDFRLLKDRNVYENVAFAQRIIQMPTNKIKKNVPGVLATVGLAGKYKLKTTQLSGGEQQRVALARALVNKPAILLADEPTGNLDPRSSWEIMKLFEEINANGTTVVVVTHAKEIVDTMQKRVITLKRGKLINDVEEGVYGDED